MPDERAIAEFLARVRAEPLLAHGLRVAPSQTLQKIRTLRAQDRRWLIDAVRDGRLPALLGTRGYPVTNQLRVYLQTLSIKAGDTLRAHAAFDGDYPKSAKSPYAPYWRIVRVDEMNSADLRPSSFAKVAPSGKGAASQLNVLVAPHPYDREEVGYAWSESLAFTHTSGWAPGLYALELDRRSTFDSAGVNQADHAVAYFVVRPQTPQAPIVLCWPFMTLAIYAGRISDYESTYDWGVSRRQRRVSLDRPMDRWPNWPDGRNKLNWCVRFPLLMWTYITATLQQPVDPCTSFDLHDEPLLDNYNLFLSVGHDEYWSKEMRDRVEQFVAGGGNAAFFSGNACWCQVRVEGRTLVCYKNTVEDPVGDPSRVSSLWSATGRPENILTGVSTRRGGSLGVWWKAKFSVVGNANDPLLGGLTFNAPIPSATLNAIGPDGASDNWILDTESDGAEFTVQRGAQTYPAMILAEGANTPALQPGDLLKPTGLDGTPTNFTILAAADLTAASQPGWPTIGYFTNVGTVFTASTVGWANYLQDVNVAKLTAAVINSLKSRIQGNTKWTLLDRSHPPHRNPMTGSYDWALLESGLQASAITAGIQGELFVMTVDGSILQRDMENPHFGQWRQTAMTAPPYGSAIPLQSAGWSSAMVCNLHDRAIHCRARTPNDTTEIWTYLLPQQDNQPLVKIPVYNADCVGLGSTDDAWFMAIDDGFERWFHGDARITSGGNDTTRIGRWLHSALTSSAYEGKLFAIDRQGQLVSRDGHLGGEDGVAVDIVWHHVARAPKDTFALAACAGRVFALTGTPNDASLWWRSAVPDRQHRDPGVVFIRDYFPPRAAYGRLRANGDFERINDNVQLPSGYDLVARAGNRELLFYRKDGTGTLCRFGDTGIATVIADYTSFSKSWDKLVYVGHGRVLFYDASYGQATVATINWAGAVGPSVYDLVGPGWSSVVVSNDGVDGPYLLCHDMFTGKYRVYHVASDGTLGLLVTDQSDTLGGFDTLVPIGQTFILCYAFQSGQVALTEFVNGQLRIHWTDTAERGWHLHPIENGLVFRYGRDDSMSSMRWTSRAVRPDRPKGNDRDRLVKLRDFANELGEAWTWVVGLGSST